MDRRQLWTDLVAWTRPPPDRAQLQAAAWRALHGETVALPACRPLLTRAGRWRAGGWRTGRP